MDIFFRLSPVVSQTQSVIVAPLLLLVLSAALWAPPMAAQDTPMAAHEATNASVPDVERITLDEAVDLFRENSLELHRSRAQAEETIGRARQETLFPNPEIEVSHEPLFRGDDRSWETYALLSQQIEWPGHRSTRQEAADYEAQAARGAMRADSVRHAYEVAQAYLEAAAAERRLQHLQTTTDVFRSADSTYQRRYREGEVSGYEVQRLQVERSRFEDRIAEATLDLREARRAFSQLVRPDAEAPAVAPTALPEIDPTTLSLDEAMSRARSQRPELARAEAEVQAAETSIEVARQARIPDPTLTAGYKRQSDGFEGVFLGAEVPLPFFDRNAPQIRAEQSRLEAARTDRQIVEREVEQEVQSAHEAYVSLIERHELIDGQLLEADGMLAGARSQYEEDEVPLTELVDAADAYWDAQSRSVDLRAEYWSRYYDLLRAMGAMPDAELHMRESSNE